MTPAPENLHVYSYKTSIKKGTALFSTNHKKARDNFNYFITVLTISFLLLSTSSASVEVNNLDKMILLAAKLSKLDVSNTQAQTRP